MGDKRVFGHIVQSGVNSFFGVRVGILEDVLDGLQLFDRIVKLLVEHAELSERRMMQVLVHTVVYVKNSPQRCRLVSHLTLFLCVAAICCQCGRQQVLQRFFVEIHDGLGEKFGEFILEHTVDGA